MGTGNFVPQNQESDENLWHNFDLFPVRCVYTSGLLISLLQTLKRTIYLRGFVMPIRLLAVLLVATAVFVPVSADQVIINGPFQAQNQIVNLREIQVVPAPAPPTVNNDIKEGTSDEAEGDADKPDAAPQPPAAPAKPIDPEVIRLFLMDGSVITGKLAVKDIQVKTTFGTLTVPVANIVNFRPGIDSFPEFGERINGLIAALGADDFNEREAAQKELQKIGTKVRKLLEERLKDDDNDERTRRVKKLLEEFDEMSEDSDDWGDSGSKEWIRQDTIVTTDFTIVGSIVQKKFAVASKFGQLAVNLGDIQRGQRLQQSKEEIRKSIGIEGSNIAQRQFKNTRIKLEAGDKVYLTADGTITMTPWGSNAMSTPEGAPNYGWYVNGTISAGALVGRIGDSGTVFKVGQKYSFTAKKAGFLQLAIGMNPSYATQNFPGKYNVKVRVTPN